VLDGAELVGIVPTADLARAENFYREVLGLAQVGIDEFAAVFDAGGAMLRLTLVDRLVPVPYPVLGWRVTDLDTQVRHLIGRGVTFHRYDGVPQDESGIWAAAGGARIAWFPDPDGNTLSLTQFPG
jgi:catechol 2,3-dioxygenase-like lactoylglutathione lyase family enzyme